MAIDHFGKIAASYSLHRPSYPAALFDWLASECTSHEAVWDCGAGNGQASVALAAHFNHVYATDLSATQIANAKPHPRIEYRVATAEASSLPPACADLITIAQAMHWFDLEKFYHEVRRVLKPNGLIAAWTYGMINIRHDEANQCVQRFYHEVIGPYWPAERHHVETSYRELAFPFERINTPKLSMQIEWTASQLMGYLRSWSATARYHKEIGIDPVDELSHQLIATLESPDQLLQIHWPLSILAGR
jgi:ubiquinone/menaquinone biosynthesis C-methylase UbiE